jgi:hypothetical protein
MAESTKRMIIFMIPNLNRQIKYVVKVSDSGFKQDWICSSLGEFE